MNMNMNIECSFPIIILQVRYWFFHALLSVFMLPDRTSTDHQVVMFA